VLGGSFAAVQGYGVLVLGWHYPSDVVAACAIAAGWLALGVAALGAMREEPASRRLGTQPVVWPAAVATLLAGALAAGAVLTRPERLAYYIRDETMLVAAAVALGAAALGVVALTAAGLTLVARDDPAAEGRPPPWRA
jgi:hypothetical protein